jgi:phosphoglycerate dehydrogenase-like enzyme
MRRPNLIVSAGKALFGSFFSPPQQRRLSQTFRWQLVEARKLTTDFKRRLAPTEALITTWDSPKFGDDLPHMSPDLKVIAHCGGEVKTRFARPLFSRLTITNAADPMARATAELGAAFLLYCARNVDFYRDKLKEKSNRIYEDMHLHGGSESVIGRTVAMIGFGRIGRALVDLLGGFDVNWLVHDPYVPRSWAQKYPVKFVDLQGLLPQAHLLVLTAALTDKTRGLLGKDNLAQLPDGAAVINIARGGLVDLAALQNEVRRGRLRCALDVTDPLEPLPIGDVLRTMRGAIVTPHIAGSGRHVREEIARVVIDDLERFFHGKNVKNRVTTSMLARMT